MSLKYEHLIGRDFLFGTVDCYSMLRDFYAENFDLHFPNYARPNEFWRAGMDMYRDRYVKLGFQPLDCHPSEYRAGDVVLMAIRSSVSNHAGILLENGMMLHHLPNRLSEQTLYRDIWKNTTTGVYRHKDVVVEIEEDTTHMSEYLTPRTKEKLRALRNTA